MSHYDEDDLLTYVHQRASAPSGIAEHLLVCLACRATIEELQSITADLLREDVPPAFRAYEEQRCAEDALAVVKLANGEIPRRGTLGTVRACLRRAHDALDQHPLEALNWSAAATSIAINISTDSYPSGVVKHARGGAHREAANALRMLGQLPDALGRLESAEQCYEETYTGAYPIAQVAFARALVHFAQSDLPSADRDLQECSAIFREFGDTVAYIKAQLMAAAILFRQGAIDRAAAVFATLVTPLEQSGDQEPLARVYSNLGACSVALGDETGARASFNKAFPLFEALQMGTEKIRVHWNLARLTLHEEPQESLRPLQQVRISFQTLGMSMDAALVGLDMVEALLRTGDENRAEHLAAEVLVTFQHAQANVRAMEALAYLQAAMRARRATPALARYVREYVESTSNAFQPPS